MTRWTTEKANQWYMQQPWLVGCNFIPSNAINQLEMWQAETFDAETIERELVLAADLGFNIVRTYLHDLAWMADSKGFKERIGQFLAIAQKHGIRPILVIFDDCWNPAPYLGTQPDPKPGVHNSGWWQSPGVDVVNKPEDWGRLEDYVEDILSHFRDDECVLMWDLYNEPGNSKIKSFNLVKKVFQWARQAAPSQPVTSGVWNLSSKFHDLNKYQLTHSDIITFHHYGPPKSLGKLICKLITHGRPLICTEWMSRTEGSLVETNLPVFKENNVGCINWGLVAGKTNTIYPWKGTWADIKNWFKPPGNEPDLWFHDLFRTDGTPFDKAEITFFKEQIAERNKK